MQATIINILLLATSFLGFLIAGLIFFANRKSFFNILLASAMTFAAIWGTAIYLTILTQNHLISKIPFASAFMIPTCLIILMLYLNHSRSSIFKYRKHLGLGVLAIGVLVSAVSLYGNLITVSFSVMDNGYLNVTEFGPFYNIYSGSILVFMVFTFVAAIFAYKSQENRVLRAQILYLAVGIFLGYIIGSIFNLILPALGIFNFNNIGPVSIIFLITAMGYAATKHYLFSKQVVFSELWAFLLILTALVWFLVNISIFNFLFFLLIISICFLFIRAVLSEAKKNLDLQKLNKILEEDKRELKKIDTMKDEFLQMSTHELNTPASVIQGKMSMIFDENIGTFSPTEKEFLRSVYQNSSRLIKLFKEILETLKLDQNKAELCVIEGTDFNQIAKKIIEKSKKQAEEKNIEIVLLQHSTIPTFDFDPGKIQTVLENLVDNAIKFSSDSGKVVVEIENKDDSVLVSVIDSGCGIKEEDKKYIFSKFFQAGRFDKENPREQQGSGLGLYISKKYIELHHGKIYFESEEGKGSKFWFFLPTKK